MISKFEKELKFLPLLTFLINIALIVIALGTITEREIFSFFSSDTLYLASIFKDVFQDGSGFAGWNLNGAPNFFPDMVAYSFISMFFNDFRISYLVFSAIQYLAIILLLTKIVKHSGFNNTSIIQSVINLIFPFFILNYLVNGNFYFLYQLLNHSYHNGCFIIVLALLYLILLYVKYTKRIMLWIISIISFLGIYNDRLFAVVYVVPLLGVLVYNLIKNKDKHLTVVSIYSIVSSIVGLVLFNFTSKNSIFRCLGLDGKFMNFEESALSFKIFSKQHWFGLSNFNFSGLIYWAVLIAVIGFLIWLIIDFTGKKSFGNVKVESRFLRVFIVFSILLTVLNPLINGYYVGIACIRYISVAYYLGILGFSLLVCSLFNRNKKIFNIVIVSCVVIYVVFITHAIIKTELKKNYTYLANYYPEKVKRLDDFIEKYNLKYGVATYWNAKYATMFSQKEARVYTVHNWELSIWYHVMNSNWYYTGGKGKFGEPRFNFVILDTLDFQKSRVFLGEPIDSAYFDKDKYIYYVKEFTFNPKTKKPYSFIKN